MTIDTLQREKIKFELRSKFGSVFSFEDTVGLPRKSVSDFLRGKPNRRVGEAIDKAVGLPKSDKSADSSNDDAPHRINAGAR